MFETLSDLTLAWTLAWPLILGAAPRKWLQGDTDFHHLRGPSRQDVGPFFLKSGKHGKTIGVEAA